MCSLHCTENEFGNARARGFIGIVLENVYDFLCDGVKQHNGLIH